MSLANDLEDVGEPEENEKTASDLALKMFAVTDRNKDGVVTETEFFGVDRNKLKEEEQKRKLAEEAEKQAKIDEAGTTEEKVDHSEL